MFYAHRLNSLSSWSISLASPNPLSRMLQPRCASARAIPRPIPLVEPVTRAVRVILDSSRLSCLPPVNRTQTSRVICWSLQLSVAPQLRPHNHMYKTLYTGFLLSYDIANVLALLPLLQLLQRCSRSYQMTSPVDYWSSRAIYVLHCSHVHLPCTAIV